MRKCCETVPVPYHLCVWAQISAIQPGAENYWKGQLLPAVYLTCTEFAPKATEKTWGKDFHLAQSLSEKTSILKPLREYSQIKIETYVLKKTSWTYQK